MVSKSSGQTARVISCLAILAVLGVGVHRAEANPEQIKTYKKVYPEAKPQCVFCHLDKIPKKDVGKHDLNAYGTKVKSIAPEITEESFKAVGPFEDFKDEGTPAAGEATQTEPKPACDPSQGDCDKATSEQQ